MTEIYTDRKPAGHTFAGNAEKQTQAEVEAAYAGPTEKKGQRAMANLDFSRVVKVAAKRGHAERRRGIATALLLTTLLAANAAAALEANEVFLDATYLGAPTEWCPASSGVPTIVKMDGPDIVDGPQEVLKTVRERAGGKVRIVHTGEHTGSLWNGAKVDQTVIGRFEAEFETCHGVWGRSRVTGSWRLIGPDGSEVDSGVLEDVFVGSFHLPFFQPVRGSSSVHRAKFGDRFLHTATQPEVVTAQTFAAEQDKE